jgi:hypothetical protein
VTDRAPATKRRHHRSGFHRARVARKRPCPDGGEGMRTDGVLLLAVQRLTNELLTATSLQTEVGWAGMAQ